MKKKTVVAISVFVMALVGLIGYPVARGINSSDAAKNMAKVTEKAKPREVEAREKGTLEVVSPELNLEQNTEPETGSILDLESGSILEPRSGSILEPESESILEPEPQVYVLIDLSEQHLSVVKAMEVSAEINGEVLFETGIVSGTANTSRATPTGTYTIDAKVAGKYLRPSTGGEFWVDYWMPFNGGIGLHDASWRSLNQFGTQQYTWRGSHGCINLSHDAAATIYDLVEVGTTVLVVE